MKVCTVVFGSVDSKHWMSVNSAMAAGAEEPTLTVSDIAIKTALESGAEYCHFMGDGQVILPSFYHAATLACDCAGSDYAYCHSLGLHETGRNHELL